MDWAGLTADAPGRNYSNGPSNHHQNDLFIFLSAWGSWAATLAWTLWWINVVLSLGTNLLLALTVI
jgi:hypothetical protein